MPTTGNYFHLHLVSDSTGETLITVARAVAAQYTNVTPVEHVYPLVRSQKQLDRVLDEIEEAPGIVLFTLLEKDLVSRLEGKCKDINIPSLSIIGPVMQLFEAYLGKSTAGRVGAQHVLNAEYFARIDALNYTMLHDDGQLVDCCFDVDRMDLHFVGAQLDDALEHRSQVGQYLFRFVLSGRGQQVLDDLSRAHRFVDNGVQLFACFNAELLVHLRHF